MCQTLRRYIPTEQQIQQCATLYNGRFLSLKRLVRLVFGEYLNREALIQKIQETVDYGIRSAYARAQPLARLIQHEHATLISELCSPHWETRLFVQNIACSDESFMKALTFHLDPYGNRSTYADPYDLSSNSPDPLYAISHSLSGIQKIFSNDTSTQTKELASSILAELKGKLSLDAKLHTHHDLMVWLEDDHLMIGLIPN